MIMNRLLSFVLLCAALGGCVIGLPQYRAGGVESRVTLTDRGSVAGELIAAMPDRIIILDNYSSLVIIYYSAISSARFQGAGVLIRNQSAPTDSAKRTLLRSLSAYPQGVSDSLLELVRKAHGASIGTVRR